MVIDFSSMYENTRDMEHFLEEMFRASPFAARRLPYPQVNIFENADSYVVDVNIPGVDPNEVELVLTARNLVIKGERKSPEGRYYRQERTAGHFQRVLTLNVPVERDKVTARSENGILRIQLPKAEAAKPRKIAITG